MTHKAKVLALLSDGNPHTHHEIYALGVIGHSRVADLRKDGYRIECRTEKCFGETVSVYQLVGSLEAAAGRGDTAVASSESSNPSDAHAANVDHQPVRDGGSLQLELIEAA